MIISANLSYNNIWQKQTETRLFPNGLAQWPVVASLHTYLVLPESVSIHVWSLQLHSCSPWCHLQQDHPLHSWWVHRMHVVWDWLGVAGKLWVCDEKIPWELWYIWPVPRGLCPEYLWGIVVLCFWVCHRHCRPEVRCLMGQSSLDSFVWGDIFWMSECLNHISQSSRLVVWYTWGSALLSLSLLSLTRLRLWLPGK